MSITYNGSTLSRVTYNGDTVTQITYNGTTVWSYGTYNEYVIDKEYNHFTFKKYGVLYADLKVGQHNGYGRSISFKNTNNAWIEIEEEDFGYVVLGNGYNSAPDMYYSKADARLLNSFPVIKWTPTAFYYLSDGTWVHMFDASLGDAPLFEAYGGGRATKYDSYLTYTLKVRTSDYPVESL